MSRTIIIIAEVGTVLSMPSAETELAEMRFNGVVRGTHVERAEIEAPRGTFTEGTEAVVLAEIISVEPHALILRCKRHRVMLSEEDEVPKVVQGENFTRNLLGVHVPKDPRICVKDGCGKPTPGESVWCDDCKDERKEFFRRRYYEKQGWDTSKL